MRTMIAYWILTVAVVLVTARVLAQETIATPDPVGAVRADAGANPATSDKSDPASNNWRYRRFNGRWWYWSPQNRWLWHDDGADSWVEFDANHSPPPIVQPGDNLTPYDIYHYYPGPGYYYPRPGYWTGYYPGVAVGVGPYGNVGVGVGRRVGVDVWGPHGGVRVGRTYIGW